MAEPPVKTRGGGEPPAARPTAAHDGQAGRGGRARATRRRIADAAAALFIARGYGATTLSDIAERAGVAVQTVYFHFGNKRTLLGAAIDLAAAGDDEPVGVLDRPWMDELRQEPDPRRALELWARTGREIFERIAPIMGVVRDAARQDAEVAEQWRTNEAQRLVAFTALARLLADRGDLKPDLPEEEAADIVFALNSIEVYTLLTSDRGWSPARWERWLAGSLAGSLLR